MKNIEYFRVFRTFMLFFWYYTKQNSTRLVLMLLQQTTKQHSKNTLDCRLQAKSWQNERKEKIKSFFFSVLNSFVNLLVACWWLVVQPRENQKMKFIYVIHLKLWNAGRLSYNLINVSRDFQISFNRSIFVFIKIKMWFNLTDESHLEIGSAVKRQSTIETIS